VGAYWKGVLKGWWMLNIGNTVYFMIYADNFNNIIHSSTLDSIWFSWSSIHKTNILIVA